MSGSVTASFAAGTAPWARWRMVPSHLTTAGRRATWPGGACARWPPTWRGAPPGRSSKNGAAANAPSTWMVRQPGSCSRPRAPHLRLVAPLGHRLGWDAQVSVSIVPWLHALGLCWAATAAPCPAHPATPQPWWRCGGRSGSAMRATPGTRAARAGDWRGGAGTRCAGRDGWAAAGLGCCGPGVRASSHAPPSKCCCPLDRGGKAGGLGSTATSFVLPASTLPPACSPGSSCCAGHLRCRGDCPQR